jgi:hypothetical protein
VLQDWHLQIEEQGPCAETMIVNHNSRALIWDCLSCLQDWHLQVEEQGESGERVLLGMIWVASFRCCLLTVCYVLQDWHLQIQEQGENGERTLLGMNYRLQRTLHDLSAVSCLVTATCR